MSETKKLQVVRGSLQHPELVREWLKEQGATDLNGWEGDMVDYYHFVTPSNNVDVICIESPILEYVDYEVVELEQPEQPECKFKPFDKVLVRDSDNGVWQVNHFSHIRSFEYRFVCEFGAWSQCIPYEGNEHLLNTTDKPVSVRKCRRGTISISHNSANKSNACDL